MHKKMNKILLSIMLLFLLVGFSGCERTDSSDIRTAGIYAKINASANESGITNIKVRLTLGPLSNTALKLSGGDRITATTGDITKDLRKDSSITGDVKYVTSFDVGNDLGSKFRVSFDRAEGIDAPNSIAFLPAPFSIDMPAVGDTFSRNDNITLVWSPAGGSNKKIDIDVSSDCGYVRFRTSLSSPVDSAGMVSYQAQNFLPASLLPDALCETRITLRREIRGTIDSSFEGGFYHINQRRSVTIKIEP